jgi:hypothetical protein
MGAVLEGGVPIGDPSVVPAHTHQHVLLSNLAIPKWNAASLPLGADPDLHFMTIQDDVIKGGVGVGAQYPAATIRVPRAVVFHSQMQGKGPPPHTIHWHGIEPTPVNDGVGHHRWSSAKRSIVQPNFIGSYFYHCHRNTMQHFEFDHRIHDH